jgi:hypothetical protein
MRLGGRYAYILLFSLRKKNKQRYMIILAAIIIIIIQFNSVNFNKTQQPGGQLQKEHVKKREIKKHIYKQNTTQGNFVDDK